MLTRIATVSIVLTLAVSGAAFAATLTTGTKITLHSTHLGRVLATTKGLTLYLTTHDSRNKSRCGSSCVQYWPPLLTKAKPVAGPGVHRSLLGRTRRSDGSFQVTYNGHPLYRYFEDSKPGQTNGEGQSDRWYVVGANGKKK